MLMDAGNNSNNLISNFGQIEEARITCSDFKSNLMCLLQHFDSLINQINYKGLTQVVSQDFDFDLYHVRVD